MNATLQSAGLPPLSIEAEKQFQAYLDLLMKWNARLNLTAIREPGEIVQRHFIESIFAAQHLPAGIGTLLDLGSGGGFPGVPIAICRPEILVTLAESQSKKAVFLRECARTLPFNNVEVFAGRAEILDRQFDVVTLRAVDKMEEACRTAYERTASQGYFAPFSTLDSAQALMSAFEGVAWQEPLPLPGSEHRVLLLGRKTY